jgi:Holliday junction resolvase RusA-like endonuclease
MRSNLSKGLKVQVRHHSMLLPKARESARTAAGWCPSHSLRQRRPSRYPGRHRATAPSGTRRASTTCGPRSSHTATALRIAGRYRLHVHLSPPDARKRDADNALKTILDALVKGGYLIDDSLTYMRELLVTTDDERLGHVRVEARIA